MAINERRNTFRMPVELEITEEYRSKEQCVTAINISENGMHYQRPKGTGNRIRKEVMLTFSLQDRLRPIKVLSWIVDEREVDENIATHVTFMFLPEKDEETIRNYVALHDTLLRN